MARATDTEMRVPGGRGARAQLRSCAAAFTFLTRIPAWRLVAHDPSELAGAAVYFPLVGLAVGAAGAVAFAAALALWPPYIAAIVSVASTVWITGAFHEDALADSFDGFGGGWDRAQILEIMKDSRVGSYGLVASVLTLAIRIAALYAIFHGAVDDTTHGTTLGIAARSTFSAVGSVEVARALIAAHVLARWSSVWLMARHPYVRDDATGARPGTGKPFAGSVTRTRLAVASALALLIVGLVLGRSALPVVAVSVTATLLSGRYFVSRIGGITGDALGAANQCIEVVVYLTLAARV